MTELKQVILFRKDLKPRKGKMVAQSCHAAIGALCGTKRILKMDSPDNTYIPLDDIKFKWFYSGQKTVCLQVRDLPHLEDLEEKAKELGLTTFKQVDHGSTEFAPGTITCLAIGPNLSEEIDKVTGDLELW